jgi:glycosyltransferase involved in cell wall biosynthesis
MSMPSALPDERVEPDSTDNTPVPPIDGKILLVSWCLAPLLTGSAVIVENLAAQFRRDELVLAGERPASWNREARSASMPRTYHVSREWTWPRRGRRFVLWVRWFTLPIVARRLWNIIRREQCSIVLAIYPSAFYLCAAYLAARLSGATFYPYYHNTYLENCRGLSRHFARWLQARTFTAKTVFVMSAGMQRFLEPYYPGVKFVPLVHTFTDDLDPHPVAGSVRSPVRIAFLGNVNDSNREALVRCVAMIRDRGDCELTIYTGTALWAFAKTGIAGPKVQIDQVPYDQVVEALRQHDVLLLPHGFEGGYSAAEYATIFPTRTISYLVAGRPILAHSPPHAFLTQWLKENDCAEVVDEKSSERLSFALDNLIANPLRRTELVQNALLAARQFRPAEVIGVLRRELRQCNEPNVR